MTDFEKIIERVNCERAKLAEIEKTIQSIREPYNAQRAKLNLEEASAVAPYGPIMAAQKLEIEVAEKEFVRLRKNAVAAAFKEKAPGDLNELKDWIQCVGNDILAARGDDPIERFYMEPLNCAEKAGDCKIIAARITKYYEKRIYCVFRGAGLFAYLITCPSRHPGDYSEASAVIDGKVFVFELKYNGPIKPVSSFFKAVRAALAVNGK
jgi:hypothetical protein